MCDMFDTSFVLHAVAGLVSNSRFAQDHFFIRVYNCPTAYIAYTCDGSETFDFRMQCSPFSISTVRKSFLHRRPIQVISIRLKFMIVNLTKKKPARHSDTTGSEQCHSSHNLNYYCLLSNHETFASRLGTEQKNEVSWPQTCPINYFFFFFGTAQTSRNQDGSQSLLKYFDGFIHYRSTHCSSQMWCPGPPYCVYVLMNRHGCYSLGIVIKFICVCV